MIFNIIAIVFFFCKITIIHSYARWMTTDFCERKLVVDEIIMHSAVVYSDECVVKVFRDSIELKSGDNYRPNDKLTVVLSKSIPNRQHVFVIEDSETNVGMFPGGGCNQRRSVEDSASLIVSSEILNNSSPIKIIAGWAYSYETVKVTASFILTPPLLHPAIKIIQSMNVTSKRPKKGIPLHFGRKDSDQGIHNSSTLLNIFSQNKRLGNEFKGLFEINSTVIKEADFNSAKEGTELPVEGNLPEKVTEPSNTFHKNFIDNKQSLRKRRAAPRPWQPKSPDTDRIQQLFDLTKLRSYRDLTVSHLAIALLVLVAALLLRVLCCRTTKSHRHNN